MGSNRDQPGRSDDPATDQDAFEEWLQQIANSKNVSKQDVIDQMMSSYWIFSELSEFIGGAGTATRSESDGITQSSTPGGSLKDEPTSSPEQAPSRATDDDLIAEIERIQRISQLLTKQSSQPTEHGTGIQTDITRLKKQIDEVQQETERLADELNNRLHQLDTQSEPLAEIEEINKSLAHLTEADGELQSSLDSLQTRLEDLESEQQSQELRERLEELDEELASLSSGHSAIETRLNKNFGHLEDIINHLFDQYTGMETEMNQLKQLRKNYEASRQADNRLDRLKRQANHNGIQTANCARCSKPVNICLLEEPSCIGCDAPFTDLTIKGGITGWFKNNILEVGTHADQAPEAPHSREMTPDPERPNSDTVESAKSSDPRPTEPTDQEAEGEFVWSDERIDFNSLD